MITYAYVKTSPKTSDILENRVKIEFPIVTKTTYVEPKPSVNMQLEGELGELQNKLYNELAQTCKDIAISNGINQWVNIMSAQVIHLLIQIFIFIIEFCVF